MNNLGEFMNSLIEAPPFTCGGTSIREGASNRDNTVLLGTAAIKEIRQKSDPKLQSREVSFSPYFLLTVQSF